MKEAVDDVDESEYLKRLLQDKRCLVLEGSLQDFRSIRRLITVRKVLEIGLPLKTWTGVCYLRRCCC